ncbi:chorismate synthase [Spirochaeta thermophila]|uniref:Chorismate synthase n=1 Tax=Winmispira thermophila (strain ATCC 49972 / DSM 6192 / RI 19.B1) TaxID=665571 RepID=E0RQP8_WINT6|nr:chorismate synthase [Spirochaeta thermophila]ADN01552.1 chorismate synthase [Spirochaeta thermophila DSM 6192]
MPGNSFGTLFRITTFGESHGHAVGVIVDGVPPLLDLSEEDIQKELDRRKPGQSEVGTPRKESDIVHIYSGVFQGKTTGTPLMMILYNQDTRPGDYEAIARLFRPGHADYTYHKKYRIRDYRGSGRASGRETAARVAAGAVAKKILAQRGISIIAYTLRAAGIQCRTFDPVVIEKNPMRACDPEAAEKMVERIRTIKEETDSVGGIVECRIRGVPPGLGEPVFDKLDADLAKAMLSIGAVKGIEFGAGFRAADMRGSEHNDQMNAQGFLTNNAGGILGGISTGEEIVFRVVVKPTSSIARPQRTIDIDGNETEIITEGRHDACICPRIVPVVEAMAAIVIEDHYKRQEAMWK